jgi:release factor glutamine methyltransferase
LSELPGALGVGTDISAAALQTARANAGAWDSPRRAHFVACDYAAALSGPFDLIVSNPPYIRSADIAGLAPRSAITIRIARWTAAPTGLTPIAR